MATYYIGANDEHGQNPPTAGKRTPVLPYLNRSFYENEFNRPAKNKFIEACLRCGFDVFDVKPEIRDVSVSTRVSRINRQNLTLLVTFGYNAFGNGTRFNSAQGASTFYSPKNVRATNSKALAEELYLKLIEGTNQVGLGAFALDDVGVLENVNCVSALVEPGFMTNLAEAKLMVDPDFQTETGEECCSAVCEFLGVNYLPRELKNFPLLRTGSRGNFVEVLQFVLLQQGYNLAVDGVFGERTRQAVIAFQTENGLVADGIVGANTWRTLLVLPPRPTLRQGDRGSYVRYAQAKLTSKLYPLGAIDGVFGNATRNAVVEFQQENGLTADGIVGPRTWEILSRIGGGRT